ncbi:MAG: hypothetical protein K5905_15860 [Roseibium sp.]|uniref:hypothetical protein n=1 Tax=Roseibium sp. TaxID=1936156 RepID=UPI00260A65A7|nr:hypothetical protein [Roseibium sp.]MCV0426937.1 hypothetical protein [Roseibium sp.]
MPIVIVVLAATVYNAVLAVLNAHVSGLGFTAVAATEMLILLAALVLILNNGLFEKDIVPFSLLIVTLVFAVYVSVISRGAVIDYLRNILIIFCFVTLGTLITLRGIRFIFLTACGLVFVCLLLEIYSVDMYGDLFFPGLYFENTRGLERKEYFDTKLFHNALGFEGRFTFGLIGHRSSSLFLEQVSLANFAGVMMIALLTLWKRFSSFQRVFCIVTISLILLTNDSRTMLIFGAICFLGYFAFPYFPKVINLLYLPVILFAGFLVYIIKPDASGDNIPGRVVLTMNHLLDLDLTDILGFAARSAGAFADSGYVYVIVIGTVFSLVLLWLFVSLYPACDTPEQRRFSHAFSIFMFMNMMIGGTAVFSIKIAGLLWLLTGFMKLLPTSERVSAGSESNVHAQQLKET